VLRLLMWRMFGLFAALAGVATLAWLLGGGPGRALRGELGDRATRSNTAGILHGLSREAQVILRLLPAHSLLAAGVLLCIGLALGLLLAVTRTRSRRARRYVRLRIAVYRTDQAAAEAIVRMFEALHKRTLRRWWRRLLCGQPSVALEVHHSSAAPTASAWLAVTCLAGCEEMVQAALQTAYPNSRLEAPEQIVGVPPAVLRLKKHAEFIRRVKALDHFEHERAPPMNRLLTVMGACAAPAFVQLAMTPTPAIFESASKRMYKRREAHLSRERREHAVMRDRSMVEDAELRGGLDLQHSPLFFTELRVIAPSRDVCERIASELRVQGAENRLVERGTAVRHGLFGVYTRRVLRGEGNPLPAFRKGVFAATELAAIWQMPSIGYGAVPFARSAVPLAPAPPGIFRPPPGEGTLSDARGPVSIHVGLRKQNTAVPGTVEQGKSSYLVASVAEDLRRERCAVIVLDPKGDAAEAAVSLVAVGRTCTLLDLSRPTCGFNPLAVDAPADVIADYVVAALKNLFTDGQCIFGP
jgi:hypothetical protein